MHQRLGLPGRQRLAGERGPVVQLGPGQRLTTSAAVAQLAVPVEQVAQRIGRLGGLQLGVWFTGGALYGLQVLAQRRAGLDGQVEGELGGGVLVELAEGGLMKFPRAWASSMTCSRSQGWAAQASRAASGVHGSAAPADAKPVQAAV